MEDMRDRKKIISAAGAVVLIVISVITVIPLLKLGVYDHPCADDFGYSIQTYQVWQETHSLGELIKTAWSTSRDCIYLRLCWHYSRQFLVRHIMRLPYGLRLEPSMEPI